MAKLPKKVLDRFAITLKNFQSIAVQQKDRDVSEADTVTLVKDVLSEVFGFDKYTELTSEQQIRGTFCDLAVKIDGKIQFLIEVKSAGVELTDAHLRQALNYAANQGIEWIVLTNAISWRLHKVKFGKPIDFDLVSSFELPSLSLRNKDDLERMFLFCREGVASNAMDLFHQHAQLLNKFTVAQVTLSEPVVAIIRREFRKFFPDLKISPEDISTILVNDILKREVIEGEKVKEAQQTIKKGASKSAKRIEKKPLGILQTSEVTSVVVQDNIESKQ